MKITKNVLHVKSTKENYDAEESDWKRNTIRWFNREERDAFEQMLKTYDKPLIRVCSVNSTYKVIKEDFFVRDITDARPVLVGCGRWLYVISW